MLECDTTAQKPIGRWAHWGISTVAKHKRSDTTTGSRSAVGKENGKPNNPYSIEVLRRAFDILSVFSHAKPLLSLAEIVAAVQLPKTTVFRVLSSLVERGYCEWDAQSGRYSLGFELLRLADVRPRQGNVHDVAVPVMREIRNAVNETVILSVRTGASRVHIDFVEGLHAMRRMADLGVPAPLYAGAASKVLLAGNRAEPATPRQVLLPAAAIGRSHLCGVAALPSVPIKPLDALSGERHKLTNTQIRPRCKKAAGFCNTIGPKAAIAAGVAV
jgi:hypothetical protein